MTESAVKEFQTRDGQCGDVDGIVGAQTRKRLAVYGIKP
jgi:peptidoglycan hydrolase-like protein with peptidoglycan-binding domain